MTDDSTRRVNGQDGPALPLSSAPYPIEGAAPAAPTTNGRTNGHTNGHTNGRANGHTNGHTNGRANGHTNGHVNGHAHAARPVQYTCSDGIAVATLASPQTRNALSPELLDALDAACEVAVEEGARALVLIGAGRTFCAGGDLAGVNDALSGDIAHNIGVQVDRLHGVISMLRNLPMPTVAAVNGAAVGAGFGLALAADTRVVSRTASFVTGYLAVSATPDGGSSYHLSRALGAPQALSAFLTNRRLTADDLQRAGLADVVVDEDQVLASAIELARGLAALSFDTVRTTRELVERATTHSLSEHLDLERARFVANAQTPEFRDAVAPFARRAAAPAPA